MKKTIFITLFTSIACISSFAQEKAKLNFIGSTGFNGSAVAYTAFFDDSPVCKLNNKKYSIHYLEAGDHTVSVQFAGKKSKEKAERLKINMEAGKTYYVQLISESGMFVNNLYCQEITENSAKQTYCQNWLKTLNVFETLSIIKKC